MRYLLRIVGVAVALLFAAGIFVLVVYRVPDRPVTELTARWASPTSQFVQVDGMSVHLRDEGPRDDPAPVLLLHGTSSSLHTWDGWTARLAPYRRVVRFDIPGFGLTGPSPTGNYTIESYVRTVIAVADALGVERFIVAGNSLGGYVAWATAMLHPDRVERLILVDAAGYPFQSQSVPIAFRIARTPVLNRVFANVLPRSVIESSLENVYGDPSKVAPALVDRYFDLSTRDGNRQALVARFEQTKPGPLAARIPELALPTLILWGAKDRLIPVASGERFAREIKGSRLVVFPALGHVPHEEDPETTVRVVEEFLLPAAGR